MPIPPADGGGLGLAQEGALQATPADALRPLMTPVLLVRLSTLGNLINMPPRFGAIRIVFSRNFPIGVFFRETPCCTHTIHKT